MQAGDPPGKATKAVEASKGGKSRRELKASKSEGATSANVAVSAPEGPKTLSVEHVSDFNARMARRGVVYLSRIPPFMGPQKVKQLLSQHGEVTRVFLEAEDKSDRKARRKTGGSKTKRYVEGWVEFADKKLARLVALSLNNTKIGGNRRSAYFEDIWNIKYLKGFKWDHLTEKLAYERRVKQHRMRAEMLQARRENAQLLELAEKGKAMLAIEKRKRKRKLEKEEAAGERSEVTPASTEAARRDDLNFFKRRFRQRQPIVKQPPT